MNGKSSDAIVCVLLLFVIEFHTYTQMGGDKKGNRISVALYDLRIIIVALWMGTLHTISGK